MADHLLHPPLAQHQIDQGQVKEQVQADVVVDEIEAANAAGHNAAHLLSVIDEDVVALVTGSQATTNPNAYCEIAQIGAVAPERGVKQSLKGRGGISRSQFVPILCEPVNGRTDLGSLLDAKGIAPLQRSGLEVAGRLQQTPVEVDLGKVPGQLQPSASLVGSYLPVPASDAWGILDQRAQGLGGYLMLEDPQPPHHFRRIAIVLDDLADDLRLALDDGLAGKGAGLGGHQGRRQLQVVQIVLGHIYPHS